MATDVVYNSISIFDCLTNGVDVEPFTAPGGDVMFYLVRIAVTGVVREPDSLNTLGIVVSDFGNDGANLLVALSTPRRRFQMRVDGSVFLDILPATSDNSATTAVPSKMDVNNGPKPKCRILEIIGGVSARVEFSIELAVIPCTSINGAGVLCFRYWTAEDYEGRTWLCTRRHEGFLRLASRKFSPLALKAIYPFIPPIGPHFERKRINFDPSDDGLELRFQIIDEEKYACAPYPATEFECDYSVAMGEKEVTADAELRVALWAPRDVPKAKLHTLARQITRRKLHVEDLQRMRSLFVLYAVASESDRHNRVEYVTRIRAFPYEQRGAYGLFQDEFGKGLNLPGYNPARPPQAAHATASPWGLFLQAMQYPCNPAVMLNTGPAPFADLKPKAGGQNPAVLQQTPLPPGPQTLHADGQKLTGVYGMYRLTNDYEHDTGTASFPVGKSSNGAKVATVRLHQGFTLRHIRIMAERLNQWPEMPKPQNFADGGIGHVLQNFRPTPHAPQLSGDGRKLLCAVDYDMTFALSRPLAPTDNLPVGNLPFLKPLGVQMRAYQASQYRDPTAILGSSTQLTANV